MKTIHLVLMTYFFYTALCSTLPDFSSCTVCGTAVNQGTKKETLLTAVKKGRTKSRYSDAGSNICVDINQDETEIHVQGYTYEVKSNNKFDLSNEILLDFTLHNKATANECYCAILPFVDSYLDPNYNRVQSKCAKEYAQAQPSNFLCPKCENKLCQKAAKFDNAPMPVYDSWNFYSAIDGTIQGPGISSFIKKATGESVPDDFVCSMDIEGLPLAQMYCSNTTDYVSGFGYGVNGKNFNCGLSFWFSCQELSSTSLFNIGDINLEFGRCPLPPTPSPTFSPTTPLPTAAPVGACAEDISASFDFSKAVVVENNLGGVCGGSPPEFMDGVNCGSGFPQRLRFNNIGIVTSGKNSDLGATISLIIKNESSYEAVRHDLTGLNVVSFEIKRFSIIFKDYA